MNEIAQQNLLKKTDQIWRGVSDVWFTAQTVFEGVYRWGRFEQIGMRSQDDLQHSYSVTVLAMIFLEKISPYHTELDQKLVLQSFLVHDHGEGELKRDFCINVKKPIHDVEEYIAFCKRYSQLESSVFSALEKAYLLQHAGLKDNSIFPENTQNILNYLLQNKYYESLCFKAIEVWDYLLYALEQNRNIPDLIILPEVARNQIPVMDYLAQKLPGFKEEIWTPEISHLFHEVKLK